MKTYIKVIIAFVIGLVCAIAISVHGIVFLTSEGTKVIVPEVSQVAVTPPPIAPIKTEVVGSGNSQAPVLSAEERLKILELRVSILEAKLK